jgi:arginase
MKTGSLVQLIAVPYDSGRRGERMGGGPETLMPLLAARLRDAGHRVQMLTLEVAADEWPTEIGTAFHLAAGVAHAVRTARDAGAFPLVLSGNCGPAALGCVAGGEPGGAVFWFDAHGDLNTPDTTISGFLDGMALAAVTGRCWPKLAASIPGFHAVDERVVALVGARDLDPLEAVALQRSKISHVPVASFGPELTATIGTIAERSAAVYVHIDLDVLDPSEGRVNHYASPGGLSCADVTWAIREITSNFYFTAAALTAYDPAVDTDGRALEAAAAIALVLIERAPAPAEAED